MDVTRLRNGRYEGRFTYDEGLLRIKDQRELSAAVTADFELVPNELFLREGTADGGLRPPSGHREDRLRGGGARSLRHRPRATPGVWLRRCSASTAPRPSSRGRPPSAECSRSSRNRRLSKARCVLPKDASPESPSPNGAGKCSGTARFCRSATPGEPSRPETRGSSFTSPSPVAEHPASLVVDLEGASLGTILDGLSGVSGSTSPLESRLSGQGSFTFAAERPRRSRAPSSSREAPASESLPVVLDARFVSNEGRGRKTEARDPGAPARDALSFGNALGDLSARGPGEPFDRLHLVRPRGRGRFSAGAPEGFGPRGRSSSEPVGDRRKREAGKPAQRASAPPGLRGGARRRGSRGSRPWSSARCERERSSRGTR